MKNFTERAGLFHSLCSEKRVSEALNILAELRNGAETVREFVALGFCLSRVGMFEEAERALDLVWPAFTPKEEDTISVASERATVKLHLGRFEEGVAIEKMIRSREWFRVSSTVDQNLRDGFNQLFRRKLLEDECSANGKSIFVIFVGGLGDAIEQIRNVERLLEDGATSIFADPPEPLCELLANSALPVILKRATIDNLASCDAVAFGNLLNWRYSTPGQPSVPHGNYLAPMGNRKPAIPVSAESGKRKIGIVWRSKNATWAQCRHEPFRSMELSTLEPFLTNADVQFYSLQYGPLTGSEREVLTRHGVIDKSPHIHSFADLADVMMQLDLLITIDSAPAHLAGALGVPVWMMLAAVADWRWGDVNQKSTYLYRSMKLFRQSTLGEWAPVAVKIASELMRVGCPEVSAKESAIERSRVALP
ncbi:hypothetical protein BZM27_35825 [Paraburkholderia steynii]|uniref:Glycosyltransferase n=1 Tax=Paraburkholderia steynii TaxID=1245441 RepID=A0A4R0X4R9_9BURK|nr:hypothetical protein BZM27_35825 [Paraburkholderia steynii]